MNDIEKQEKETKGKAFNVKKVLSGAAVVVAIAGVATVACLKTGVIGEKKETTVVEEKQSEAGKNIPFASNDKIKSLYEIEEYTSNLADSANGNLAFLKVIENNELQAEKENDYYKYTDRFGNVYKMKEITNVTSEEGMMGSNDWAALFKVTVEYLDNNNEAKTEDLAVVLSAEHEASCKGAYLNFTGTTEFVKAFTDLYTE